MANTSVTWQQAAHTTDQPPSPSKGHTKKRTSQQKVFMHFLQRKKPREGAISGNRRRPKKKKRPGRRTRGEQVKTWNEMTAVGFPTVERHQTSSVSLGATAFEPFPVDITSTFIDKTTLIQADRQKRRRQTRTTHGQNTDQRQLGQSHVEYRKYKG